MNGEDLELQMPSDLRGDGHEDSKPFLSSATANSPTEANKPQRKGILRLTVDVPLGSGKQRTEQTKPPRWRTPEFYFYYLVFAFAIPIMVWTPIKLSGGIPTTDLLTCISLPDTLFCRDTSQLSHIQSPARGWLDIWAQACE